MKRTYFSHRQIGSIRRAKAMTQATLARKIGRKVSTLSHWENGRTYARAADVGALAFALGVGVESFYVTRRPRGTSRVLR